MPKVSSAKHVCRLQTGERKN